MNEIAWQPERMLEVKLKEPDDFLKVRETLSRIGVASRKERKLYQSCHILHKQCNTYLVYVGYDTTDRVFSLYERRHQYEIVSHEPLRSHLVLLVLLLASSLDAIQFRSSSSTFIQTIFNSCYLFIIKYLKSGFCFLITVTKILFYIL